jgi:transposase InsO family protein
LCCPVSSGDDSPIYKLSHFNLKYNSVDQLLLGPCDIGWVRLRYLIDTGASINVISMDAVNKLKIKNHKSLLFKSQKTSFILPNGAMQTASSILETKIYLFTPSSPQPISMKIALVVAEITTSDIILGTPFLTMVRATIRPHENSVTITDVSSSDGPKRVQLLLSSNSDSLPIPKLLDKLDSSISVPDQDSPPPPQQVVMDLLEQQSKCVHTTSVESSLVDGAFTNDHNLNWRNIPTLNSLDISDTVLSPSQNSINTLSDRILDEPFGSEVSLSKTALIYSKFLKKELSSVRQDILQPVTINRSIKHSINFKPGLNLRKMRPYRENAADTIFLRKFVDDFLKAGLLVVPDSDEYASPAVVVPKKDGGKRLCCDYRLINEITIKSQYPLPNINDLFARLAGAKVFSKIDLEKGFYQVEMNPKDIAKTAFRVSFGLFAWKVMPMGLSNSPATFQRLMDSIFSRCDFVACYLDDLLVFSKSADEHVEHLRKFFNLLRTNQLAINKSKCEFFVDQIDFLGHTIGENMISMQKDKLQAIGDWPLPKNRKNLQSFLGLCNYYRSFIPNYSTLASPLTDLTSKSVTFAFNEQTTSAFMELKRILTSADVMALYDPNKTCIVQTDASSVGIGGVLLQPHGDKLRPVEHFSAKLSKAARNYPVHERELLAIVESIRHFRPYLGTHFTVLTDHRTLTRLDSPSAFNATVNGRISRWKEYLAAFDFEIKYVEGELNKVADALSRKYLEFDSDEFYNLKVFDHTKLEEGPDTLNAITISSARDDSTSMSQLQDKFLFIQDEQKLKAQILLVGPNDPVYVDLCNKCRSSNNKFKDFSLEDELLYFKNRMMIPNDSFLRQSILHSFHGLHLHEGGDKLIHRLSKRFHWTSMEKDVFTFCRSCVVCAKIKQRNVATQGSLIPLPVPHKPMMMLTLDFITGLDRTTSGYDAILTVTCKFSKFKFIRPASTSWTGRDTFTILSRIFHEHGWPRVLVSDRDPRFTSKDYRRLCDANGIRLSFSTANHPQTDGQSEITNKLVMDRLRTMLLNQPKAKSSWDRFLPYIQKTLNESPSDVTGKSPNLVRFGFELEDPRALNAELWSEDHKEIKDLREFYSCFEEVESSLDKARQRAIRKSTNRPSQENVTEYKVGQYVYVKFPTNSVGSKDIDTRYHGPYLVTATGPNYVKILLRDSSMHDTFNIDKVKPAERRAYYPHLKNKTHMTKFSHISLDDKPGFRACFYVKGQEKPYTENYIAEEKDPDMIAAAIAFIDTCCDRARKVLVNALDDYNTRRLDELTKLSDETMLRETKKPTTLANNPFHSGHDIPEESTDSRDPDYDPNLDDDSNDGNDL